MVFDQLKNLNKYILEDQLKKIECFLDNLSSEIEEGYYENDGEDIYARVMSYSTSLISDCKIEAHYQYIDIQSSLIGEEGIDIFDRDSLEIVKKYDIGKDVAYYRGTTKPYISVKNIPGYFSMIFPEEAHQPQISLNQHCERVKKFVIKIKV